MFWNKVLFIGHVETHPFLKRQSFLKPRMSIIMLGCHEVHRDTYMILYGGFRKNGRIPSNHPCSIGIFHHQPFWIPHGYGNPQKYPLKIKAADVPCQVRFPSQNTGRLGPGGLAEFTMG